MSAILDQAVSLRNSFVRNHAGPVYDLGLIVQTGLSTWLAGARLVHGWYEGNMGDILIASAMLSPVAVIGLGLTGVISGTEERKLAVLDTTALFSMAIRCSSDWSFLNRYR